jgi:potassium/hydrogen antiporter
MFAIDHIIFVVGVLVLLGILSSKLAGRAGVPVLVLFLLLGMLAGSEGIGGIAFEDFEIAHAVGTIALGLILYDGGLRTQRSSFARAWRPALAMSTVGVLLTAMVTGAAAAWLLGIPLAYGLLLGSIIASTDAAAVFASLRHQGVNLDDRLASTLEIESGSNDPMAIFLTVALIEIVLGRIEPGVEVAGLFAMQMGVGALVGIGVGWLGARLINHINLDAAGLYPVLAGVIGILAYGTAAVIGGSGFLAVYLAGVVVGNSRLVFQRGIFLFHDGAAWIGQIGMFVLLGLLSSPSRLLAVAWDGLLMAAILIVVARPLAVLVTAAPFGFNRRELTFLSWAGLKGAVPIVLAIFPLLLGVPEGQAIFDLVFFAVLVSAVTQGWSLPVVARWLGLQRENEPAPPVALEISSVKHIDGDIVEYAVGEESRAAGRRLRDLALPEGVVVALIARGQDLVPPSGSTRLEPGDFVFVVLRPAVRPAVDRIFSGRPAAEEPRQEVVFPLRALVTVAELEEFYGVGLSADGAETLGDLMERELDGDVKPGDSITRDGVRLTVEGMERGRITTVGLSFSLGVGGDLPMLP